MFGPVRNILLFHVTLTENVCLFWPAVAQHAVCVLPPRTDCHPHKSCLFIRCFSVQIIILLILYSILFKQCSCAKKMMHLFCKKQNRTNNSSAENHVLGESKSFADHFSDGKVDGKYFWLNLFGFVSRQKIADVSSYHLSLVRICLQVLQTDRMDTFGFQTADQTKQRRHLRL